MSNIYHKIFQSDVYAGIFHLEDNSIDCAITSPPYWGQRDYGFDGQIGSEDNYRQYIEKLVIIFDLLRTKLKNNGVFFLNIGDKYLSKYGKTPLAMIPYKLAYRMNECGWILEDTIIWYKPNHMPSSVKNRFANSYEPVFVFSKYKNNIFNDKKNNNANYTNILKINLQPSSIKHIAAYPENLVKSLFKMLALPSDALIIDPFAGSGTTLKVILDMNSPLEKYNISSVMIENNNEYIEIMKGRFPDVNIQIISYKFFKYFDESVLNNYDTYVQEPLFVEDSQNQLSFNSDGQLLIFDSSDKMLNFMKGFFNGEYKKKVKMNSAFLIGCKQFDIELLNEISLLNSNGWIIRNMVIVEYKYGWFPLFLIVDNNNRANYIFNYKNLNLKNKSGKNIDFSKYNFIGMKVVNKIDKRETKGYIVEVIEEYDSKLPKYVLVKWQDSPYTKEFVIYDQEEINKNLIIEIKKNKFLSIKEKKEIISLDNIVYSVNGKKFDNIFESEVKRNGNYKGKYSEIDRKNWGASPGARASVEEIFFSVKRLYDVNQNLIADYLNYKRGVKKLSKNDFTRLFPIEYKHTVGHWLRKDFGGSLPVPEDWNMIIKFLDIDESVTNYVCKRGLKIQFVLDSEFKTPEDFINYSDIDNLSLLLKSE